MLVLLPESTFDICYYIVRKINVLNVVKHMQGTCGIWLQFVFPIEIESCTPRCRTCIMWHFLFKVYLMRLNRLK